ncbi:Zinc finger, RAN-binding domain containing 2 [Perkinsus chesapeaki]|uniref:Zinc finger, RAN-binding domain containing 2 n=1 Tax=Perkinsus chesapeaki TaxID=330153 RepID=A0A7J6MHA5_PERCH|nr:Zinc finger, RAN-binding domain containing 2 [Perkinsus chesapeaki]
MICRYTGSVFPRTLLPSLFSTALATGIVFDVLPFVPPTIDHPFAVQIFAIILGYVIVFRTDMALNRYWEGVTNIHLMASKWGDAFMQINSFINVAIRTSSTEQRKPLEVVRSRTLHWFSLLSAIAISNLNGKDQISDLRAAFKHRSVSVSGVGLAMGRTVGAVSRVTTKEREELTQTTQHYGAAVKSFLGVRLSSLVNWSEAGLGRLVIIGPCTDDEILRLKGCDDKTTIISQWIEEALTRVCVEGLINVSRVPFPFPFAQMVSLLLLLFLVMCPIMVVKMTEGAVLSPILSFFCLLGYWGLNEIAVELENPFGDDDNDLPLEDIHKDFVDSLQTCALMGPATPFHHASLNKISSDEAEAARKASRRCLMQVNSSNTAHVSGSLDAFSAVAKINEELCAIGVDDSRWHFGPNVALQDLAILTLTELRQWFGHGPTAVRVHRRIKELSADVLSADVLALISEYVSEAS